MRKFANIFILAAAVMWGCLGIYVKSLRELGLTSLQISAVRWIFAAVIALVAVFIFDRKKLKIALRDVWLFAVIGIFSSLAMTVFYFLSMEMTSIAVSDVLMYTSPIWVMIFSAVFFKEKITVKKIASIAFAFSGCVLVSGLLNGTNTFSFWGVVFGVLSGVAYSLYSIVGKFILKKYDKTTLTVYNFVFAGVGAFFVADIGGAFGVLAEKPVSFAYVGLLAVLGTIVPFFLYSVALKYKKASKAAVLCCIEPVAASIVSVISKEPLGIVQCVGIALIIMAIVILQFKISVISSNGK